MNTDRKTAIITGVVFITATAAALIGSQFTDPIMKSPDYLASMAPNGTTVIIGALFAILAAVTSSGIALALYPVLKRYNPGLAIASVGFRLVEGVFYMIGVLCLLSLLNVSQQFIAADSQSAVFLRSLADLLRVTRDLSGFVFGVLAFCLGALMYYVIFFQTRLVPRWLSIWGLVAVLMLFSADMLTLFDGEPYAISGNLLILVVPIFFQEIALAIWLIVKGFNPSASATGSVSNPARQNAPGAA